MALTQVLITGFRCLFPQHSTVQSLNATHQWKTLQEIPQAAQQAEDDFLSVTRVAREAVELSQAFSATATEVLVLATKPRQAYTQVKPRLLSTATSAVEEFHGRIYPLRRGGK